MQAGPDRDEDHGGLEAFPDDRHGRRADVQPEEVDPGGAAERQREHLRGGLHLAPAVGGNDHALGRSERAESGQSDAVVSPERCVCSGNAVRFGISALVNAREIISAGSPE